MLIRNDTKDHMPEQHVFYHKNGILGEGQMQVACLGSARKARN
jgi:hypothetical protein